MVDQHFKLRSSLKADFCSKQGAPTATSRTEFEISAIYDIHVCCALQHSSWRYPGRGTARDLINPQPE